MKKITKHLPACGKWFTLFLAFQLLISSGILSQIQPVAGRSFSLSRDNVNLLYQAQSLLTITGQGFAAGSKISVKFRHNEDRNTYASISAIASNQGTFAFVDYQVDLQKGGAYTVEVKEENALLAMTKALKVFKPYNELRIDGVLKNWSEAITFGPGSLIEVSSRGYFPNTQYIVDLKRVRGPNDYIPFLSDTVTSDEFGNWRSQIRVWNIAKEGDYHLSTGGGKVKVMTLVPG